MSRDRCAESTRQRVLDWSSRGLQRVGLALPLLLAGCASQPPGSPWSAPFPPGPATRVNGYAGATRPQTEVATVFILDGRPKSESGYICALNGKPLTPQGACASVVYLLPGTYTFQVRYQSHVEEGSGDLALAVQANKVYQLNATSFRTRNAGMISLLTVRDGGRVSHRNVAPGLFAGPMLDESIPYGPSP